MKQAHLLAPGPSMSCYAGQGDCYAINLAAAVMGCKGFVANTSYYRALQYLGSQLIITAELQDQVDASKATVLTYTGPLAGKRQSATVLALTTLSKEYDIIHAYGFDSLIGVEGYDKSVLAVWPEWLPKRADHVITNIAILECIKNLEADVIWHHR